MSDLIKIVPIADELCVSCISTENYAEYSDKAPKIIFADVGKQIKKAKDIYHSIRRFNPDAFVIMRITSAAEEYIRIEFDEETCWIIREPFDLVQLLAILEKDEFVCNGALIVAVGSETWFFAALKRIVNKEIFQFDTLYEYSKIIASMYSDQLARGPWDYRCNY